MGDKDRSLEVAYHEIVHALPDIKHFVDLCNKSLPYHAKVIAFQELCDKLALVKQVADNATSYMDHG